MRTRISVAAALAVAAVTAIGVATAGHTSAHPWGLATSVAGIECYASGSGARRRYRELDRTRYFLGSTEGDDYLVGRCLLRLSNDLVDPKWVHQYRDAFEAATRGLTGGVAVPAVIELRLDQAERVLSRDHLGYKGMAMTAAPSSQPPRSTDTRSASKSPGRGSWSRAGGASRSF
jgi:hypothetical protein